MKLSRSEGGPVTEFRKMLEGAGLRVPNSHFPVPNNDAEWSANIERAHKLNLQYMLCAGPPGGTDSLDAWKRAAAFFNHLGTLCQKAGMQFAYHNHNHEFVVYDGVIAYDELLRSTDPALVKMELDCFWMTFAGKDPVEYMHKYPGRFPLLHIKGLKAGYSPQPDVSKAIPSPKSETASLTGNESLKRPMQGDSNTTTSNRISGIVLRWKARLSARPI